MVGNSAEYIVSSLTSGSSAASISERITRNHTTDDTHEGQAMYLRYMFKTGILFYYQEGEQCLINNTKEEIPHGKLCLWSKGINKYFSHFFSGHTSYTFLNNHDSRRQMAFPRGQNVSVKIILSRDALVIYIVRRFSQRLKSKIWLTMVCLFIVGGHKISRGGRVA